MNVYLDFIQKLAAQLKEGLRRK